MLKKAGTIVCFNERGTGKIVRQAPGNVQRFPSTISTAIAFPHTTALDILAEENVEEPGSLDPIKGALESFRCHIFVRRPTTKKWLS